MKIAICDDNSLQIDFFKAHIDEFLKKCGDKSYTLNTYSSGKPLIDDIADGQWYDIVVLDVVLNNENGINVAKQLRKMDIMATLPSGQHIKTMYLTH